MVTKMAVMSWKEPHILNISCCTSMIFKADNSSSKIPWKADPVWTHSVSLYFLQTVAVFIPLLGSSIPHSWQKGDMDYRTHNGHPMCPSKSKRKEACWAHTQFISNRHEQLVTQVLASAVLGNSASVEKASPQTCIWGLLLSVSPLSSY